MIRAELAKQVPRLKTFLLLGLTAGLPVVLTLVFKLRGAPAHAGGPGAAFVDLATDSGVNMALVSLGHVGPLLLPIVAAIFAGSAVAEEASWRTLGYLLVRPVTRGRLLAAKLAAVVALIAAATAAASLVAVGAGVVGFGWEPVHLTSGASISPGSGLARVAIATLYIAWSLAGVLAVGFFVSTLSDAPLSGVAAAVGVVVLSQILDSLSALGDLRSALLTHYWSAWEGLFASPVTWGDMLAGAALQLPYLAVPLALAFWWFGRKDILT